MISWEALNNFAQKVQTILMFLIILILGLLITNKVYWMWIMQLFIDLPFIRNSQWAKEKKKQREEEKINEAEKYLKMSKDLDYYKAVEVLKVLNAISPEVASNKNIGLIKLQLLKEKPPQQKTSRDEFKQIMQDLVDRYDEGRKRVELDSIKPPKYVNHYINFRTASLSHIDGRSLVEVMVWFIQTWAKEKKIDFDTIAVPQFGCPPFSFHVARELNKNFVICVDTKARYPISGCKFEGSLENKSEVILVDESTVGGGKLVRAAKTLREQNMQLDIKYAFVIWHMNFQGNIQKRKARNYLAKKEEIKLISILDIENNGKLQINFSQEFEKYF